MQTEWIKKKILITVKTYPVPARKGVEVSCTAGITEDGKWIRLFPMPYRLMDDAQQFRKYEWIEAPLKKAGNDSRPESFNPQIDQIEIGDSVSTKNNWSDRWDIVRPLVQPSMCGIQRKRDEEGSPTLGIFKPTVSRLIIEKAETADWSQGQKDTLSQTSLFYNLPDTPLQKIPYDFKYEFRCADPECKGHTMTCTDWEMGQSYRSWARQYGNGWEEKFREKYEQELVKKRDLHFFVGNLHQHPGTWIVVGLFYPPLSTTLKTPLPPAPGLFSFR